MRRLHFVTEWTLDAPMERVWDVLSQPELFPTWWPGFEEVTTVSGMGDVGTVTDHRVSVGFGLRLRFRMEVLERRAPEWIRLGVAGDSAGTTEWRLRAEGGRTAATHVWDVEVQRPVLRFMSRLPGAPWFFAHRHYGTMRAGRRNVERLLNARPP